LKSSAAADSVRRVSNMQELVNLLKHENSSLKKENNYLYKRLIIAAVIIQEKDAKINKLKKKIKKKKRKE